MSGVTLYLSFLTNATERSMCTIKSIQWPEGVTEPLLLTVQTQSTSSLLCFPSYYPPVVHFPLTSFISPLSLPLFLSLCLFRASWVSSRHFPSSLSLFLSPLICSRVLLTLTMAVSACRRAFPCLCFISLFLWLMDYYCAV